ncbi:hypothetical protein JJJ17_08975 [Paracoccus caeni]|uniref:Uncharacterized protein n=1 Tax=Paracoccus caeni TaxID=657651 RepID=A0A934SFI7_9RHOB|nr:hypothetical protein [Paracoccus caeni]MBK4216056.1 hypothetical protein [Paracoccus caeni]
MTGGTILAMLVKRHGKSRATRPSGVHRTGGKLMHMVMVICGGFMLLATFALFGKLWGGDAAGISTAIRAFIPVWLLITLVNMWVGVTQAGYTYSQEAPILLLNFAIPAAVAITLVGVVLKA